jgi:hypothetical protein
LKYLRETLPRRSISDFQLFSRTPQLLAGSQQGSESSLCLGKAKQNLESLDWRR